MLIRKCVASQESDTYLGTPDDQRMVQAFGDYFGDIRIGTGKVSSGCRVTNLKFIRWRATVYGAPGQFAKRSVTEKSNESAAVAVPETGGGEQNETEPVGKRLGKNCSNINCPVSAHYLAARDKRAWSKCAKDCQACKPWEEVRW